MAAHKPKRPLPPAQGVPAHPPPRPAAPRPPSAVARWQRVQRYVWDRKRG